MQGITLRDVPKKLMVTSFLLDNIESRKEGEERTWKSRFVIKLCQFSAEVLIAVCLYILYIYIYK